MPKEFLHLTHTRSTFKQVGCKRMPQGMRGHAISQLRRLRRAPDGSPGALSGHCTAPRVQEEDGGSTASCGEYWASTHPIRVKSIDREGPHGNDSFFTSFAKQAHDGNIAVEIQVVGAERHSLGYASTRRVKKFEQSCVAQANRGIVCMSGVEEAPNLID